MLTTESGFITAGDAQLHYEISGGGEPLVLIHGFGMDCRMWEPQIESFATRWQVIRYDLRGFGRSSVPEEGQAYAHAEDLAGLLVGLGIQQAHLCGLSLGGEVAVDFALRYPGAVLSLTLVDSVLDGFEWSERQRSLDGDVWRAGREVSVDAARARWKAHPLFVPLMQHPDAWSRFEAMVDSYSGWHWQHRNPATWVEPEAIERLGEINLPSLVVVGERDLQDFLEVADVLAWGIHHARKVLLPGAGHLSPMEAPDAFAATLINFLWR